MWAVERSRGSERHYLTSGDLENRSRSTKINRVPAHPMMKQHARYELPILNKAFRERPHPRPLAVSESNQCLLQIVIRSTKIYRMAVHGTINKYLGSEFHVAKSIHCREVTGVRKALFDLR